jgi:hypothetical protein
VADYMAVFLPTLLTILAFVGGVIGIVVTIATVSFASVYLFSKDGVWWGHILAALTLIVFVAAIISLGIYFKD